MIDILKSLEPRRYIEGDVIYHELEEILEMTFVMNGGFAVGYEINKQTKYKLRFVNMKTGYFKVNAIFGGFNCLFFKRS